MHGLVPPFVVVCSLLALAIHASPSNAADLRDVSPVTDRILMLHVVDGRATPEGVGEEDGRIESDPLDVARAQQADSYRVTSADDPRYAGDGLRPAKVGRKSKGADFISLEGTFPYVLHHWLYLVLPEPMQRGKSYTIDTSDGLITSGAASLSLTFDEARARSETVHVNQIGFVPSAPQKFAYLSHWMGDLGPLALDDFTDAQFHVIDTKSGRRVFSGKPALRKRAADPDNGQADEQRASYAGADVWELDFSTFATPGEYVVSVDRVGCSFPFRVDADVYREPFVTTARGLYHQRCGVELRQPYTTFTRPACHVPSAAKPIRQTSIRYLDTPHHDGGGDAAKAAVTGETRDVVGGWHDAGDWDREDWHIPAADTLMLAYELSPRNFTDGELNIPESGNGLPDVLDEAAWCVDYFRRLQRADGGVSVGLFMSTYPHRGWTSWADPMDWYCYVEDPAITYRYASSAARMSWCLELAGKPERAPSYRDSAIKAFAWAETNQRDGDAPKVRDDRNHAAAALFKATGEERYHDAFKRDLKIDTPQTLVWIWAQYDQQWAAWTYATTDRPNVDAALQQRLRAAAVYTARAEHVDTAARRAGRMGYHWYIPTQWGAATRPRNLPLIVAHHLTRDPAFLAPQYTTCDYVLGGNPLNTVWVTGSGDRSPGDNAVMHWDSWYDGRPQPVPGLLVMGPSKVAPGDDRGPWSIAYQQKTCYPAATEWPIHELWFENRLCPPTNEFTIGMIAEAAAAFGYLRGPAAK
jgi:endoglucanase